MFSLLLVAAADAPPLPHAAGRPDGPGPGCGGGFTAARGDTLYSIARRCETTVTELVQENRLGRPPQLAAGQQLDIPGFARGREALVPPDVDQPSLARARPDREPPLRRAGRNVYYFQRGDTLYSLARWAGTSLPALRAANPGLDPRGIDAGMAILLPQGAVRPERLRARERGEALPIDSVVYAPPPPTRPPPPPRPPRPAPPPRADDDADKPKPDDADEDDGPTPGGMDDGGPEPDGMF
jgi:LysM repeat protein